MIIVIIATLCASILFNMTGLIDTYLIKRFDHEEQSGVLDNSIGTLMIFASIASLGVVLGLTWRKRDEIILIPYSWHSAILLCTGILYGIAALPYFYALQKETIDNLLPFLALIPLRTTAFASMILGEYLSPLQIMIIVVVSLLTMVFGFNFEKRKRNYSAIGLMILCAALYALRSVLFKWWAGEDMDFWVAVVIEHLGVVLVWIRYILQRQTRITTRQYMTQSWWKFISANIANEGFYIVGIIILNILAMHHPVAMIGLVNNGSQPLLWFAMTYLAYRIFPQYYERPYTQRVVMYKTLLMIVIIILLYRFFSL